MKKLLTSAFVLALMCVIHLQSFAQTAQNQDADFVRKAADGGMLEVQLGQLALKKGSSQKIKDYAKMMVDDHTKVNNELKALAKKKNMEVPAQLSSQKQMMQDSLNAQSGNEFDMLYMNMMLASHEEAVGVFQEESTSGKDAELKKWADSKIPALKHHLEMAKKLFNQK